MCNVFPKFFFCDANEWFNQLSRKSIASFKKLATSFFNRFFQRCCASKAVVDILIVRQHNDESLTKYLTRFTFKVLRRKCTLDELLYLAF